MLDTATKRRIDTARDILVGKVPDPKSQVEQITIALIYKFMDDMDIESEELGGIRTFFANGFSKYSWAKLMRSGLGGHETLNLYAEAISRMPENPGVPALFRSIFKNAYLPYRDPETLKIFLKVIDEFEYDHSERLGDAFEYLLSVLGSQGDAGQFRTPRHIIDFMVKIMDPKKDEKILDPACGTAGFLISSYKHIIKANEEKPLTPSEREVLARNIKGYDISPDMVRLSLVNLYLHGFNDPHIEEYDTLTSEDKWNEYADVILANPPFMSPKGGIKPHKRFTIQAKRSEVLFVDYMAEHLTPNGRAAIIVPEGIIFQSGTAYKQLRKMLVENSLVAVISLPAGVFQPYSGVKTSILILDKSLAKQSQSIGFFKVENDGFSLGAQRRETDKNDLPQVQAELEAYLLALRSSESTEKLLALAPTSQIVSKEKIAANSDYNLSGERYQSAITGLTCFPMVPLGEIAELIRGITFGKAEQLEHANENSLLVATTKAAQASGLVEGDLYHIPRKLLKNETKLLRSGDILISTANSLNLLGRTTHLQKVDRPISFGAFMSLIRHNSRILDGYLIQCLRTTYAADFYIRNANTTTNISNLNLSSLAQFKIPLPPLEVQKEIVAEIEGYQKVIDGARAVIDNYKPRINKQIKPISIRERVTKALEKFVKRDSLLINLNANERAMTAKISHYLQDEFPEWDVDHEYNRDQSSTKELDGLRIYPDIIIHKRGQSGTSNNFLVIEVKKEGVDSTQDKLKLKALRDHYGYQHAVHIIVNSSKPVESWISFVSPEPQTHCDKNAAWPMVVLGELMSTSSGGTPLKERSEYYVGGAIPWLKSGEVSQGLIMSTEEKITEAGLKNSSAKIFPAGTVVVAMYGATAGQVGLLGIDSTTNQAICGILPNPSIVPLFLYYHLKGRTNELISLSTGGAQPNISQSIIRSLKVPLPPLETQQTIVAEIAAEQALVNTNRELIERFEKKIQATIARVWGDDQTEAQS